MERLDAGTGIVGGGLITDSSHPQDWERRIGERSEQLYRARLVQRFFLAWAYLGNLVLVAAAVLCYVLFGPLAPWVPAVVVVVPILSIVASARFVYRQHFRVRAVDSELREFERAYREYLLEDLGTDLLGAHKRYRAQLPDVIGGYRLEARRHRRKHNALQSVIIAGSIVTSAATAASVSTVDARGIAVVASLLVAVAAAFAGYAKHRERSASLQQAADALEREYEAVELRVGKYRRFGDEREAYAEFADQVEALRKEQAKRQQQLGQSVVPTAWSVLGQ
jgi:hypothetical protein